MAIYRYVTEGSFDAYMWQALETKAKFIGQVMTGDLTQRSAGDIGGQELSYAEVKAIASGNPAVLTLAEADAELQRLSILKKNHADEQFLARRALRELPEVIERAQQRIAGLSADVATAGAYPGNHFRIGGQELTRAEATESLAFRLKGLPERVPALQRIPLGSYRGLAFGLVLHPHGTPEAYLEGKATRHLQLSREHQGPRAVLNAVTRLLDSYPGLIEGNRRELALADTQLRDYRDRLGATFAHEDYLKELRDLRDQLRLALSGNTPEPGAAGIPTTGELAARITSLRSEHAIEGTPERTAPRTLARAEEPVTRRIKRRLKAEAAVVAETVEPDVEATEVEATPAEPVKPEPATPEPESPAKPPVAAWPPKPVMPAPSYRERISRGREDARQLRLF